MNQIPTMDNPLGKHWPQPLHIQEVEMDSTHVLLTKEQVAQLLEYSASYPSGVYPGKCWKRIEAHGIFLVWYGPVINEKCRIEYRKILEV